MGGFGVRGQGPGEFMSLSAIIPVEDAETPRAWLFDVARSQLTLAEFDIPYQLRPTYGDDVIQLESGYLPVHPGFLGDSLIVSFGLMSREARLAYFDAGTGSFLRLAGDLPPNPKDAPLMVAQHAYTGEQAVHPGTGMIVLATLYADQLEVYHPNGEPEMVVRGPEQFTPTYDVRQRQGLDMLATTKETRFGYIDVEVTDRFIYALYSGRYRSNPISDSGRLVHVIDWEGRLHRVYDLGADASGLAVDEALGRLYGTQQTPRPAVLQWKLPDDHLVAP
jgi:hypothetical protein